MIGEGKDAPTQSDSPPWREQLLRGLLLVGLALTTVVVPVLIIQTRLYESLPGFALALSTYASVAWAVIARQAPYKARAFALLLGLGTLAMAGFLRVGFQVGPGVGGALIVVSAGLLLGPRAMWIAFATTLLSVLGAGVVHQLNGGIWIAPGANDIMRLDNWVRGALMYSLFTGVLATAVAFVVRRNEATLAERTRALDELRSEQAQRKQTETALDHAHGTIAQMQKLEAVGRLAGGVAHDFNNALVVILGWADALKRMTDEQKRAMALDEIIAAGSRAARLTQQLLTVGRKAVTVPAVLSPGALLAEIGRFVGRVLPENIRLRIEVASDAPLLFADAAQLHHVILNLCLNARDAMPQGGELVIRALRMAGNEPDIPAGAWAAIQVEDTGTGMDAATLERMFEPFFTTKGELGTGLGLSTVHGIATQSGGHVRVQSVLGQGTTFTVLLPIAAEQPAAMAHSPRHTPSQAPQHAAGTVLIAEDDRAVRDVMVQALRDAGHEVLAAEDGMSALELARRYRGRIDLLCSDGVMPGISTADLISGFKHLFPDAPIIVCSGHIRELGLRKQLETGDVRYLAKPFTGRALAAAVNDALTDRHHL
jgi:signal transduction histidine kinase/ActR/RegA family two-component response regulator